MIEILFDMQRRALSEARKRYAANDFEGGAEAAIFAYHCYELARELLNP